MRRAGVVAVLILGVVGLPARASAPSAQASSFALLAEAVFGQLAGPNSTLVTSDARAARALGAGDLDADGLDDVILVSTDIAPGGAMDVEVRALSAADGTVLWGPVRSMLRRASSPAGVTPVVLADGMVWVGAAFSFDGDAAPDVLLADASLNGARSSIVALSGADGSELWRDDGLGLPGPAGGIAEAGIALPLASAWDVDRDGAHDVLIGRFSAVGASAARIWTLDVVLRSGDDASALGSWRTQGIGVAPTATLAAIDGYNTDVLVADVTSAGGRVHVGVRRHTSGAWGNPAYGAIADAFATSAPATGADIAVTLHPLAGEGFPEGGFAVGIVGEGPSDHALRASLVGPSSFIGLGRGGIERFRIELPTSAVVDHVGDLNGDGLLDIRTVRVDGDALLAETWSGRGTTVALRLPHQMSFLEGSDYAKHAEVHAMADLDGDGAREQLIGGGYPCGPRFQVLDGDGSGALWQRGELRSLVCFGRLFPAGVSLGGAVEDIVDWTTNWACCLFGPSPVSVSVRARDGLTGATLWDVELDDGTLATAMTGRGLPDLTGDGHPDLLLAAEIGFETTAVAMAVDGRTGAEIWRVGPFGA